MTLGQRLKVLRGTLAVLLLSGIGLVISIAIGPSLLDAFREDIILGVAATLFFLMCLLTGLGCAIAGGADLLDVVLGRARSADGPIKVHTESSPPTRSHAPFRRRTAIQANSPITSRLPTTASPSARHFSTLSREGVRFASTTPVTPASCLAWRCWNRLKPAEIRPGRRASRPGRASACRR